MSTDELETLFNQQLCEYREIQDLKEKLAKAEARHLNLCAQIQKILPSNTLTLTAITDKGKAALPKLMEILGPLV